jgi:hypothetical protein
MACPHRVDRSSRGDEPDGATTGLEVTGPAGTREFLAHEIGDAGWMPDDHIRGE